MDLEKSMKLEQENAIGEKKYKISILFKKPPPKIVWNIHSFQLPPPSIGKNKKITWSKNHF